MEMAIMVKVNFKNKGRYKWVWKGNKKLIVV